MSAKIESVERKLEEKNRELLQTPDGRPAASIKEEVDKLRQVRDKLQKQRATLDDKLEEGSLLTEEEDRRYNVDLI